MNNEWITYLRVLRGDYVERGGPGSGNWGHAGRKGKRGGSAPRKGVWTLSGRDTDEARRLKQARAKGVLKTGQEEENILRAAKAEKSSHKYGLVSKKTSNRVRQTEVYADTFDVFYKHQTPAPKTDAFDYLIYGSNLVKEHYNTPQFKRERGIAGSKRKLPAYYEQVSKALKELG